MKTTTTLHAPAALALALLFTSGPAPAQTPLLPGDDGIYYYMGHDAVTNREVFIKEGPARSAGIVAPTGPYFRITTTSTTVTDDHGATVTLPVYNTYSGTYCYVDIVGNLAYGAPVDYAATPVAVPYRLAIQSGTVAAFQLFNRYDGLGSVSGSLAANGAFVLTPDYTARSGAWTASDITLKVSDASNGSGIWLEGYTPVSTTLGGTAATATVGGATITYNTGGTAATTNILHTPAIFTGTNINIMVDTVTAGSRQAVSLRHGASAYIYGGTLSKTNAGGSETIYMVSNGEGLGSSTHFHGEDLTIITGSGLNNETFNLAAGHNTVELYRSTITDHAASTYTILLNGTPSQGGDHFYGENLDIYVGGSTAHRAIGLGSSGGNSITLVSTTITANIVGKTLAQEVIYLNDPNDTGGNRFYGENLTIYNNNTGRTFAFEYGENTISLKDSAITATGTGAVFAWMGSETTENRADGFTNSLSLENTNVTTTADYAPVIQQIGRIGRVTITGGTFATSGVGSQIIRLGGANDAADETKFSGEFTNVVFEAPNASVIDLDISPDDNAHYGERGGGGKQPTSLITTNWTLTFRDSTLSGATALRLATAGSPESPYSNETRMYIYDSAINGAIQLLASGAQSTTGANLFLQGTRSRFTGGFLLTGTAAARKYHQARLDLYDSTFAGPITAIDRGELTLNLFNTPVTGDLTLSGSTQTYLNLVNSPIDGSISLADTARLENNPGRDLENRRALVRDTAITGGFALAGNALLDLTFSGNSAVTGGLAATGTATATLRFEDNTSFAGGVTLSGSSSATFVLSSANQLAGDLVVNDRARLALSTFKNTPIHLDRGLTLGGIWSIPGKTTLSGTLNITDPLGTIHIVTAAEDSLTLASGLAGHGRLDIESIDGPLLGAASFRVIHDPTAAFTSGTDRPLILSHPVDYGLAAYNLENRPDGAYLVGGLDQGSYGTGGAAVFNTTALLAQDWFAALEPLNRHLADLRDRFFAPGAFARSRFRAGDLWMQGRLVDTDVNRSSISRDFTQHALGLTVGADAVRDLDHALLSTGVFADTSTTNRDFINGADGRTVSVGAGLQALWTHRSGLYASALARFDAYNHTLDTHSPNNAMSASYHTQSGGLNLEAGWRLSNLLPAGWWLEPSLALGYAKLAGTTYTTESSRPNNIIDLTIASTKAVQYRGTLALGKTLTHRWSLLARLAFADVDLSGGSVSGGGVHGVDATLGGARYEAAIGAVRLLGSSGRLHFDYAYTSGDDFTRPCTLTLGYSHLW